MCVCESVCVPCRHCIWAASGVVAGCFSGQQTKEEEQTNETKLNKTLFSHFVAISSQEISEWDVMVAYNNGFSSLLCLMQSPRVEDTFLKQVTKPGVYCIAISTESQETQKLVNV